jgi:8-oxo-dGTP pyrophosphatase MutT (NUDIX family)
MAQRGLTLRVMQTYWRWTRGLTIGAQGCVFDADGRVLLVRHGYRPGWHFPGGGVDPNEYVGDALARELREEVGVVLDGAPRLVGIYGNFGIFPSDHVVLFEIRAWRQPTVPKPTHEILEHRFFDVAALPEGTVPAVRRRLTDIAMGKVSSFAW